MAKSKGGFGRSKERKSVGGVSRFKWSRLSLKSVYELLRSFWVGGVGGVGEEEGLVAVAVAVVEWRSETVLCFRCC